LSPCGFGIGFLRTNGAVIQPASNVRGRAPLGIAVMRDVVIPRTPPRFPGESQGASIITLTMKTPEGLRPGP
jgi:hypothetical protein